jgi:hypothetical protein
MTEPPPSLYPVANAAYSPPFGWNSGCAETSCCSFAQDAATAALSDRVNSQDEMINQPCTLVSAQAGLIEAINLHVDLIEAQITEHKVPSHQPITEYE